MRKLLILTDEYSDFLVSKADLRNFTSMDVQKIRKWFREHDYDVDVCKFSALDLSINYSGYYILYQTSEAPGAFYKRYIEDLVYYLEKQGAILMPRHEYLKAHHNKVFMEFMRMKFADDSLKTIISTCYGSWVDALSYNKGFPAVIKHTSSSAGAGVFLAHNRKEYIKFVKKAGRVIMASSIADLMATNFKNLIKKSIKLIYPSRKGYVQYDTSPVSSALVVQNFIPGLSGDYKVLYFGDKFYCMYRKNRKNDFRASGSGMFFEVPAVELEGILTFARKLTLEIDFPIIGMDIGFDGKSYHLIEFQMIDIGTSALQRSKFWHEYREEKWIKFEGFSNLEEEFSRSFDSFIGQQDRNL